VLAAFVAGIFAGVAAVPAWTQSAPAQTPPNGAKVHFISLKDGQEVISLFLVQFGLSGMGAGVEKPNASDHGVALKFVRVAHVISNLGNQPIGGITRAEMVEFLDGLNTSMSVSGTKQDIRMFAFASKGGPLCDISGVVELPRLEPYSDTLSVLIYLTPKLGPEKGGSDEIQRCQSDCRDHSNWWERCLCR
jgi:hypothetical protein